jgi:phage shock protein A
LGVNTNAIVADVVLAVDEQQTDIDGLRQTVADLQTQIAQLSQQIQVLSQPAAQS